MMKNHERRPDTARAPTLEDVLDAYAAEGPSHGALKDWVARFPQFAAELVELTVTWLEIKRLPEPDLLDNAESLELRGVSILGQVLHELRLRKGAAASSQHAERELTPSVGTTGSAAPPPNTEEARIVGKRPEHVMNTPPSEGEDQIGTGVRVSAEAGTLPFRSLSVAAEARGLTLDTLATATRMSVTTVVALHRRLVVVSSIPSEALAAVGQAISYSTEAVRAYLALEPTLPSLANYKAERTPAIQKQIDFFELIRTDPELHESDRAYWLGLERRS